MQRFRGVTVTSRPAPGLPPWRRLAGSALVLAAIVLVAALSGCAAPPPNSTYGGYGVGRAAQVSYGTIVSMRDVNVQGPSSGIGALGGAAAGGVAGSFLGGDPRMNILGAIGGALIGGIAGSAVEGGLASGQAVEFIIRVDDGQTISVVQSNEYHFVPGQRIAIIRGDHLRLAPVAG